MLQEIYISNFILIDKLRMEFTPGMNVLSGETGAGKSIIIDALGLLMGDRIKSDYIRDESCKAVVEAIFDVSTNSEARIFLLEQGLMENAEDSDTLILSREIYPTGKTIGRINGRSVTAAALKSLSVCLVDMHLQNDRQNILRPQNYLDYVDGFTEDVDDMLQNLSSFYSLLISKKKQLEELKLSHHNRIQRLDFLKYQIEEIQNSSLIEGEEEELRDQRERYKNSGKLLDGSSRILELLYNSEEITSAYDQVSSAIDIVLNLKMDKFFAELMEPIENIYYSLQELSERISAFKQRLEFEPRQLEEIEDRLYLIGKLKNKYGDSIKDILKYLEEARKERDCLDQSEEMEGKIQQEIETIESQYMQIAIEISKRRKYAAIKLKEKVYDELLDLNMPNIQFEVEIKKKITPGLKGIDDVDFLFSPNPGEDLKSIARIASGGEISRFVLALKKALADVYHIPTLVFDEIDVGLGGSALNSVARKLADLSQSHQLILVTHSAQVASYSDNHFVIAKNVVDDRTYTEVKCLNNDEKIIEIARMLDGEHYSNLTLEHAREMVAFAGKGL